MELRAGYKQTEVGVIPNEWDVKTIDQIAFVTSGKRLPLGSYLVGRPTGHPYIRVTDMRTGTVALSDIKFVPESVFPAIKQYRIYQADIFISVAGSLGIVGKVPPELDGANLTENADRITNITCSQDYLLFVLLSPLIQNTIDSIRTVGAQPKLALTRIRKFAIPLPPSEAEQHAIAAALSDADTLLHGLERLIAKKRDLKQAVIQRLVTGLTRLPGFNRKWEVTSLDMIVSRATGVWGSNQENERNSHRAEIIRAGDISQDGRLSATATRYISPAEFEKAKCELDDLVITTSGNGLGKIWWCDGRSGIAASNFVRVLHPNSKTVVGRFLYYALRSTEGLRQLKEHTATSAYPNLRPSYFSTAWIPLPPRDEQLAIAAVASDMDAELSALEARREKTSFLTHAMLQELLTGRRRLVPTEIANA